jgi:hypothetical protein
VASRGTLPEPAAGWVRRFADEAAAPLVAALPAQHRGLVSDIFEDFCAGDLRKRLGRALASPEERNAATRRLHKLAVQREAVVTVAYNPEGSPPWFDDLARRVLIRIWDDEIVHEAYLCAVADGLRDLGLQRWMGYQGGLTATVATGGVTEPFRYVWGQAVRAGALLSGMMSPEVDPGRLRRELDTWAAYQAALELTAAASYVVFANLLSELPTTRRHLKLRGDRLGWKLMDIARDELRHADLFAMMCRKAAGGEASGDLEALQSAGRVLGDAARWPLPSRLGDLQRVGGAAHIGAAVRDALPGQTDWSRPGGGPPFVAVACDAAASPRSLADHGPLTTVVAELANWSLDVGGDADLWVVGTGARRRAGSGLVGTGMRALHLEAAPAAADPRRAIRNAEEVTAGGTTLLASYGTFMESGPDVLHRVWDIWALARLRVCVSSVASCFKALGQVMHSRLDFPGGPDLDAPDVFVDVPRLRELAALRLLGAYPPDLSVLTADGGHAGVGTDMVRLGPAVQAGATRALLRDAAWRIAVLAASPTTGRRRSPPGERRGPGTSTAPQRMAALPLAEADGPWSARQPEATPTTVYLYRYRAGPGVDLQGLEVSASWADLEPAAREELSSGMQARSQSARAAEPADYEVLVLEGVLHSSGDGGADVDEVLARVEATLGTPRRSQDCVEHDDVFVVVTPEGQWRPLFPSAFVSSLYNLRLGGPR